MKWTILDKLNKLFWLPISVTLYYQYRSKRKTIVDTNEFLNEKPIPFWYFWGMVAAQMLFLYSVGRPIVLLVPGASTEVNAVIIWITSKAFAKKKT